jgi:hypothetical protein
MIMCAMDAVVGVYEKRYNICIHPPEIGDKMKILKKALAKMAGRKNFIALERERAAGDVMPYFSLNSPISIRHSGALWMAKKKNL